MGIVSTIPEKCRRCYTCVRECPAKAIKVISGQATVIAELCIACGNCVKVCTQKAKRIEDSSMLVSRMLQEGERVFMCVAPSFPVAFAGVEPARVVGAIRALGVSQVWEVAFGAELVSQEYAILARQAIKAGRAVVSTPCPAIISYVQKHMPGLHGALAPIVSPMLATARAIRRRFGAGVRVVFVGPCIAKKAEIKDRHVQGTVDAVLTFDELRALWEEAGIRPETCAPSQFDGPPSYLGRSIPLSGGLLRAAGLEVDILQNSVLVTEGKDRVLSAMKEMASGTSRVRLLDVLFCEGCINGPAMPCGQGAAGAGAGAAGAGRLGAGAGAATLGTVARREILTDYISARSQSQPNRDMGETIAEFFDVDLRREFSEDAVVLPQPTEEEIQETLRTMRKFGPEDQLNCGSCGYPSCREKAIAVCQGLAEVSMCLPYLVEELESTLRALQKSHQAAQDRLVQTERLASMGQISAGVAHEINNPLSTILLYSHTLLKAHREGDPESQDIQMIANEATRCRSIMRGLLDFARQSRVVKTPTDLGLIARDVADSMTMKLGEGGTRVRAEVEAGMPKVSADGEQIRQMLVNLVQNGVDAVNGTGGGEVVMSIGLSETKDLAVLRVRDTGSGMPPETLKDIFTPFYTTKQLGKGSGMGLSIVYGVVKMHAGDITVDSEVGKGTTFHVRIPVGDKAREEIHAVG